MATFFFFFFFFFFEPGVKLDEKWIENGLEGQKFLVVCLFWGGCHHPDEQCVYLKYHRKSKIKSAKNLAQGEQHVQCWANVKFNLAPGQCSNKKKNHDCTVK